MTPLRDLPMGRNLTRVILVTSAIVLSLAGIALAAADVAIYFESSLNDRLRHLAALGVATLTGALLSTMAISRRLQAVTAEPRPAPADTSRDTIAELNETLERSVRECASEVERAHQEMESFSYLVAHDLHAPLRAIDGYARLLTEEHAASLDKDGKRLLSVVSNEARRMGMMIEALLDFSRVSRQPLRRSPLDPATLVEEVVSELRRSRPDRSIELTCAPLPLALGDAATIRQVLVNLLSNAVKYAKSDGPVRIEIGGCRNGTMSSYSVRDHGVGFDMRFVEKLFGVFQRLHGNGYEGTGIGLAIVERIVTRHGGSVRAEGTPGEGACFHFTLPAADGVETRHR